MLFRKYTHTGDINSKTNTRPISNNECQKVCKVILSKRIYLEIQAELSKTTPYIYKKWLKLFIERKNVDFKLIIRFENQFLMIINFICSNITLFLNNYRISANVAFLEHDLVLRQLLEFISMPIFKHLRTYVTKQDFLIR